MLEWPLGCEALRLWSKKSDEDGGRLKKNSQLLGVQGLVSFRLSGGHGSLNPEALCFFFLMTRCFCCAGGVVGGLLAVSVVIFLLCCCFRRSEHTWPRVKEEKSHHVILNLSRFETAINMLGSEEKYDVWQRQSLALRHEFHYHSYDECDGLIVCEFHFQSYDHVLIIIAFVRKFG